MRDSFFQCDFLGAFLRKIMLKCTKKSVNLLFHKHVSVSQVQAPSGLFALHLVICLSEKLKAKRDAEVYCTFLIQCFP